MVFFERIKSLWSSDGENKISSKTICLYVFLISRLSESENYEALISDQEIKNAFGITQKTIYKSRENLKSLGLIDFKLRNGTPCFYRLETNAIKNISKVVNKTKTNIADEQPVKSKVIQTKPKAKKSIDNVKPKEKEKPKENPKVVNSNIPSFEEFSQLAKTLPKYHPELDISIEGKYEEWISNGWKNGYNKPIINWKASLKNTWPFMLKSLSNYPIDINNIPNIKRPRTTYNED